MSKDEQIDLIKKLLFGAIIRTYDVVRLGDKNILGETYVEAGETLEAGFEKQWGFIQPKLEQLLTEARIEELLNLNKVGMAVAQKPGTGYEDLSGAYDAEILKRLADLTAPTQATERGSDNEN